MFGLKWEAGNLISLSTACEEGLFIPVFYEELNLVGLNRYFDYPESDEPIAWAKDSNDVVEYWYEGKCIAKVKKGALFKDTEIVYVDNSLRELKPIDISELVKINRNFIRDLSSEAKEYIKAEYERLYKSRDSEAVMVAYSGGKDSQVVLDLVIDVLPPGELYVLFTDTKMELPPTYDMVSWTENRYRQKYPNFKIHKVSSKFDTAELWEKLGPPSRVQRWCCSVYKIAPQVKFFESIGAGSIYKTILTYEGTRADESHRRGCFERTSPREKTFKEINVRPIFLWNSFEVFLYHFYRGLKINPAYRQGLRRVGCSICPYASNWSEFVITKKFPERAERFIRVLENYGKNMGASDEDTLREYLSSGAWKVRSGGLGVDIDVSLEVREEKHTLKGVITNCKEEITEWLKTVGRVRLLSQNGKGSKGELLVDDVVVEFTINRNGNKTVAEFRNAIAHPLIYRRLVRVLNKSAYCLNCTGCEIECPHNAVMTYPEVRVNPMLCTHCGNCLEFIETGCYVAKSLCMPMKNMDNKLSVDRYSTFGLRQPWLEGFFQLGHKWLEENNLGPKQKPAMNKYLFEAELMTKDKKLTELGEIIIEIFKKKPKLAWQVVWVNLCLNSDLFSWYVKTIGWGETFTKETLVNKLTQEGVNKRTAQNAINSLINTFENSPLGEWFGKKIKEEKRKAVYLKAGSDDIDIFAISYALYRMAEKKGIRGTTVSELYMASQDMGPYVWFGIGKENLIQSLRSLKDRGILGADLVADLDNIHFYEEFSPLDVLKFALK